MSAKNKTQPTRMTLPTYLATLQSDKARADAKKLIAVFEDATKQKAGKDGGLWIVSLCI
jgi:hypothetical protein